MSFKLSIGAYWFQVYAFRYLFANAFIYFQIQYGHNSQRNLIDLRRGHTFEIYFKWLENKTKILRKKRYSV